MTPSPEIVHTCMQTKKAPSNRNPIMVPAPTHRAARVLASMQGETLGALVRRLINAEMDRVNEAERAERGEL